MGDVSHTYTGVKSYYRESGLYQDLVREAEALIEGRAGAGK